MDELKDLSIHEHFKENELNSKLDQFLEIVDDTKKRKIALKMIEDLKCVSSEQWSFYLQNHFLAPQYSCIKKISSLLEISQLTLGILKENISLVITFLDDVLNHLCFQREEFVDADYHNTLCVSTVKLCLQTFQCFPKVTLNRINTDCSKKGCVSDVVKKLILIMTTKEFPRESSWLAGTALSLVYNLYPGTVAKNVILLLKKTEWNSVHNYLKLEIVPGMTITLPDEIDGAYGQISLVNGLLSVASSWLLSSKIDDGNLLLGELLNIIFEKCMKVPDATTKYLCFKTIYQWLLYLSYGDRLKSFVENIQEDLFTFVESKYSKLFLSLVKNHIEDLVDGVPQYSQKIFSKILYLHQNEFQLKHKDNSQQNNFVLQLVEDIFSQGWYMKGRWMLLAELIPYMNLTQLQRIKVPLANDLMRCLNTCSLPAVSNEVYQAVLKHLKKNITDKNKLLNIWSMYFEQALLDAFFSDSVVLRTNLGQYWLPSTCNTIPSFFNHFEEVLETHSHKDGYLHSKILLVKAGWQSGHLKMGDLKKRKDVIELGLKSIDVELRMETFNIVCSNTKKTESLPEWLQQLVLDYVFHNQNCDSAKFRQQMFSALKKVLMLVRDSSVMLYRQAKKNRDYQSYLDKQIDFVENLFDVSKNSLIPTASFQRRKTGLQLVSLVTEIFVFVDDCKLKKKASPPDSCSSLLTYVQMEKKKWTFVNSINKELLACLENQHDEIRDETVTILCYQQEISDDQILKDAALTATLFQVALNLSKSPKYHETEASGAIMRFLSLRLASNPQLSTSIPSFIATSPRYPCHCLLDFLVKRGKDSMSEAIGDLLLASVENPLFGNTIAISNIIKTLRANSIDASLFPKSITSLLGYCNDVTELTTKLLAGKWTVRSIGKKSHNNTVSPSFADIDEALDEALSSCSSYDKLVSTVGHSQCRELFLSFCWLNLKAVSFIMADLGRLANFLKKTTGCEIITDSNIFVVEAFFRNTLIRCRHKGVIESSFTALTKFTRAVSSVQWIWDEISGWCNQVLESSTNLMSHSSVTKRSAGIPMFIQAILSSEPAPHNRSLLNYTIEHLFKVVSAKLPEGTVLSNDLPQFNAINILRSVFRDANLNNDVMRYVERGVVLTINGFSSPSWSIRNASTQLLSTLIPRMLGQRLSQEETSMHNMSTADIFFHRYPLLRELFKRCLSEQVSSGIKVLPHFIPVLIFLSRLRSSDNQESQRIYEEFFPLLRSVQSSSVFTIRNLVADSIASITPRTFHSHLIRHIDSTLSNQQSSCNDLHSCHLLCYKLLKDIHSENVLLELFDIYSTKEKINLNTDYMCRSLLIDVLVKLVQLLHGSVKVVDLLHLHTKLSFAVALNCADKCIVGRPYLEKSLARATMVLLEYGKGDEIISMLRDSTSLSLLVDFLESFITILQTHFIGFDSDTREKLTGLMTSWFRRCICVTRILIFSREFSLGLVDTPDELSRILTDSKARSIVKILPCISRSLGHSTNQIASENLHKVCNLIHQFSQPTCDENKRMAASQCIGIMEKILQIQYGGEAYAESLKLLWWSTLNLLQDEDDEIRNEATVSMQFVNPTPVSTQSNITLTNFVVSLPQKYVQCAPLFVDWMIEVLCRNELEKSEVGKDYMLFEQEGSNLYCEDFVVINLLCDSLVELQENLNCINEDVYQKMFNQMTLLKNKIQDVERETRSKQLKSINDLYQEKNLFVQFYRCLKMAEVCCRGDNKKRIIDENIRDWILKIAEKFLGIPSIKSSVQSMCNIYYIK